MDDEKVKDAAQADDCRVTAPPAPSENYLVVEALQSMPSLFSRGLLYLVIIALLCGLAYSLVGKVDVVAECRAVAIPALSPVSIQTATTGYVERVYIAEGQQVEKNSPLFAIRSKVMQLPQPDGSGLPSDATTDPPPGGGADAPGDAALTVVRSNADGTVTLLFVRHPGVYVEESEPLCNILPATDQLSMDILATNREIGFIKTGMEIKYKFDAFHYADYGVLYGRVATIPSAAVEDARSGLVYHVQGSLDKAYFESKGEKYFLRTGMTATAELVRKQASIFSILFKETGL